MTRAKIARFFERTGRAGRTEFWATAAIAIVGLWVVLTLPLLLSMTVGWLAWLLPPLSVLSTVATPLLMYPVTVRRLHDLNRGRAIAVALVVFSTAPLLLLLLPGLVPMSGEAALQAFQGGFAASVYALPLAAFAWILVGCWPGTAADNRYGPPRRAWE